jgi:hypothetical protein
MTKPQTEPSTKQGKFPNGIFVRCPASLPRAIELAARKNLTTSAEYMRRCIIDRIKADGIDPSQMAGVA